MKKLTVLAVIGLICLGLLYKFRHPIEHFHPHFRFRTLDAINISPASSSMPKGSRKKLVAIAHYRDGGQAELVSEVTWSSSNPAVAPIDAEGIDRQGAADIAHCQAELGGFAARSRTTRPWVSSPS